MNNVSEKKEYTPNLSPELKDFLEKQGTLAQFLNDYRQMCNNFKPAKIYIKDKEPKSLSYEQLTKEKREVLSKLGKSYAHTLHQLLEIGLQLDKKNKKYAIIGGMGVLGHLYDHNPRFPLKWRGTEDIDIVSKENLQEFYQNAGFRKLESQEKIDTSMIPDGRLVTYTKENPWHDKPAKIQQRHTISFPGARKVDRSDPLLRDSKTVKLYGVPISVASRQHLIETKTGIRTRSDKLGHLKDKHDITHLQSIEKLENLVDTNA